MEQEVQAPGISARGVAFPGRQPLRADRPRPRLRVERDDLRAGHRRHVRRRPLRPGRRAADVDSMHYRTAARACRSRCSSARTRGSRTPPTRRPAGTETLRTERTRLGLVVGRGDDQGQARSPTRGCARPTARARLRPGLRLLQRPRPHHGPAGLPARRVADRLHVQLVLRRRASTSPTRTPATTRAARRGTDPDLPIRGRKRYEWRGYDPDRLTLVGVHAARASTRSSSTRPGRPTGTTSRRRGYRAADDNWGYGATYRVAAARRPRRAARHAATARRRCPQLVAAMEDAATVDLRADAVLPLALRVLGTPARPGAARGRRRAARLAADGAHRIDRDRDGALRARRRDRASSTPGGRAGCRREFEPGARRAAVRRDRAHQRARQHARTTTATTSARRGRTAGTATRSPTCARLLRTRRPRRLVARLLRPRVAARAAARALQASLRGGDGRPPPRPTPATPSARPPAATATRRASTRSSSGRSAASPSR